MEFPISNEREFTQRVLQLAKVHANQIIPGHVARTAIFTVEQIAGDMVLGLSAEVLRDHIVNEIQTVEIEFPASWWQNFKASRRDKFGWRWFIRRFPIHWETWTKDVRFDRYYDYPDASIQLPEDRFGKFIVYELVKQTDWNKS